MATQQEIFARIERAAHAEGTSVGAYLTANPKEYDAYARAGRPDTPQHNPANDRIIEEAKRIAKQRGISQDQALVEMFGSAEGREKYARYRQESEARRNPNVTEQTGITPAEMVELQRLARICDYDLSLGDIADLSVGVVRGLLEDLRAEAADMGRS